MKKLTQISLRYVNLLLRYKFLLKTFKMLADGKQAVLNLLIVTLWPILNI